MAQVVTLAGTTILNPSDVKYAWYNITDAERTADGTMNLDLIAKKRKWNLTYAIITQAEMDTIMNVINSTTLFFTFTIKKGSTTETATVYVGEISATPWKVSGNWQWKDFTFDLIER